MAIEPLIIILLVGLIAGWLAGQFVKGSFGLIGDIVVGVIGALIGCAYRELDSTWTD